MDIQKAVTTLVEGRDLSRDDMAGVMRQVMSGDATDAQIGGLLVALRIKGETIEEIAGAAQVMRELATPVEVDCPNLVDLVGTGGDGANLFNVSTASTFVVAAAGAKVAKHGNRGVSSSSGSSDVLEELGIQEKDTLLLINKIDAVTSPANLEAILRRSLPWHGYLMVYTRNYGSLEDLIHLLQNHSTRRIGEIDLYLSTRATTPNPDTHPLCQALRQNTTLKSLQVFLRGSANLGAPVQALAEALKFSTSVVLRCSSVV